MGNRLKGRVAVVTGSGTGIGKILAIALAKEGAKLVTNNRRQGSTTLKSHDRSFLETLTTKEKEQAARIVQDAETTAKEIRDMGGEAVPFFGDVSGYETARNLIKTALDYFGKIDILVNNAGTFQMRPIWEMSPEDWHRVLDSHLTSTYYCTRHAAGLLKEQKWGRIINGSSDAWLGQMNGSNYSAAKGGIVSFTRAVAKDLWPYGITVNSYAPVAMTRALSSALLWSKRMAEATGQPLSKEQSEWLDNIFDVPGPEAIVTFLVYLATEEASNISGTVFGLWGSHIGQYADPIELGSIDKPVEKGLWTVDELIEQVPKVLLKGYKTKANKQVQVLARAT
jgi:3-oxoacyl-[acyl-carrier protein] reductase